MSEQDDTAEHDLRLENMMLRGLLKALLNHHENYGTAVIGPGFVKLIKEVLGEIKK